MDERIYNGPCKAPPGGFAVRSAKRDDERSFPRQKSVFRVARVAAGADEGFARLLNISDEGLMLSIELGIGPGTEVQVDLSEKVRLSGEVVWRDGKNCGVKLTGRIDSAAMLAQLLADSIREGERAMRLACATEAIAMGDFGTRRVKLEDVSMRGMKIRNDGAFREGLRLKILLGSLPQREGVVRWCRDGRAGIAIVEPFSLQDLGSTDNFGSRSR